MPSYELGIRRVNITAAHHYETADEAKEALSDISTLDVIDEFDTTTEREDEIQVMLGDNPSTAEYWAVFYVTPDNKLMIQLEFIGHRADLFISLLEQALTVVESMVILNHEIETRVDVGFESLVELPIQQNTDETVSGIQLVEDEHEYFFTAVSDVSDDESAVVVSRIDEISVTESMEEYYDRQVETAIDFIGKFVSGDLE